MEKLKGMIFFDIDGTLLDHKGAEFRGIEQFYKKYEFDKLTSFEEFRKLWVELSDKHFDRYLKKECTFEEQRASRMIDLFKSFNNEISYEEALARFKDYLTIYEENWKPYDDVIPCLKKLKEYRLGIISNGDYKQQVQKLEKMGIKEYFEDIVAAGDVGVSKPEARIFEIACERNNVDIKESYYIGDAIKTDILPCNEIGMKSVLINRDVNVKAEDNINRVFSLEEITV